MMSTSNKKRNKNRNSSNNNSHNIISRKKNNKCSSTLSIVCNDAVTRTIANRFPHTPLMIPCLTTISLFILSTIMRMRPLWTRVPCPSLWIISLWRTATTHSRTPPRSKRSNSSDRSRHRRKHNRIKHRKIVRRRSHSIIHHRSIDTAIMQIPHSLNRYTLLPLSQFTLLISNRSSIIILFFLLPSPSIPVRRRQVTAVVLCLPPHPPSRTIPTLLRFLQPLPLPFSRGETGNIQRNICIYRPLLHPPPLVALKCTLL